VVSRMEDSLCATLPLWAAPTPSVVTTVSPNQFAAPLVVHVRTQSSTASHNEGCAMAGT
jgi:hypothetical protein